MSARRLTTLAVALLGAWIGVGVYGVLAMARDTIAAMDDVHGS